MLGTMLADSRQVREEFENTRDKSRNERQKAMLLIQLASSHLMTVAQSACDASDRIIKKSRTLIERSRRSKRR
jgi:hypothetical protein